MAMEPMPTTPGESYLEWGAVLGGAAVAVAITVTLSQFGAAVGLGLGAPVLEGGGASWQVLVAGLWLVLVAFASAAGGGYLAGRMRSRFGDAEPSEVEFRDGAHGLVVWGVATLASLGALAAIAALTGAAGAAAFDRADLSDAGLRFADNIGAIYAFATAAAAALSAGAAWQAAKVGGEHRDQGISVDAAAPKFLRRKV